MVHIRQIYNCIKYRIIMFKIWWGNNLYNVWSFISHLLTKNLLEMPLFHGPHTWLEERFCWDYRKHKLEFWSKTIAEAISDHLRRGFLCRNVISKNFELTANVQQLLDASQAELQILYIDALVIEVRWRSVENSPGKVEF